MGIITRFWNYQKKALTGRVIFTIRDCVVQDNIELGMSFFTNPQNNIHTHMLVDISNVTFINNSKALYNNLHTHTQMLKISNCTFKKQRTRDYVIHIESNQSNQTILEKSTIEQYHGIGGDCSVLYIRNMSNFTISDTLITTAQASLYLHQLLP